MVVVSQEEPTECLRAGCFHWWSVWRYVVAKTESQDRERKWSSEAKSATGVRVRPFVPSRCKDWSVRIGRH